MDLATIKSTVEAWLNVTAVDANQDPPAPLPVEFGSLPSRNRRKPFVMVHRGPIVKLGRDVPRYTYDDLTDEYVEQMWGIRRMTLRVAFWSQNQNWGKDARQYAEDWRIRTEGSRSIQNLSGGYLALWGTGELIDTDFEWSGRVYSRVDVDLTLGLWSHERNARVDEGYIKRVVGQGLVTVVDLENKVVLDDEGKAVVLGDPFITFDVSAE